MLLTAALYGFKRKIIYIASNTITLNLFKINVKVTLNFKILDSYYK